MRLRIDLRFEHTSSLAAEWTAMRAVLGAMRPRWTGMGVTLWVGEWATWGCGGGADPLPTAMWRGVQSHALLRNGFDARGKQTKQQHRHLSVSTRCCEWAVRLSACGALGYYGLVSAERCVLSGTIPHRSGPTRCSRARMRVAFARARHTRVAGKWRQERREDRGKRQRGPPFA